MTPLKTPFDSRGLIVEEGFVAFVYTFGGREVQRQEYVRREGRWVKVK